MTIGFWIVPLIIMLGCAFMASRVQPGGDYDFSQGLAWMAWMIVSIAVWGMWLLSWVFT